MEETINLQISQQRMVNPKKVHDDIKQEVEKHLDAGIIYPISDIPWVEPETLCVPKKYTVFADFCKLPPGNFVEGHVNPTEINKDFKDVKHSYGMTPFCLKFCAEQVMQGDVCTASEASRHSRGLPQLDPPGDIRRYGVTHRVSPPRIIPQTSGQVQERISHKKTENQSKSDKIGHGMEKCVETKPNQRADYANWETSFMKERKWEKENDKRKDVEGPFLYTIQTFP
ncbi:hypothetical protein Tco_0381648 [Tanacetum coccineum]